MRIRTLLISRLMKLNRSTRRMRVETLPRLVELNRAMLLRIRLRRIPKLRRTTPKIGRA
jgi:hypothetical protein